MYLSKLEILGFKSFAQKTQINFNQGVTSIVGPNGCGKTNVVDALRWCLGEQKSSTLRSDKMENVIFNGTAQRKPMGMAEVSLTCLLYTSDAADERSSVDLGGRRIIKKNKKRKRKKKKRKIVKTMNKRVEYVCEAQIAYEHIPERQSGV